MVSTTSPIDYYIKRKKNLLRQFDRVAKRAEKSLKRHHGEDFAEPVLDETRREYEKLIPQLPYVGGRANFVTSVIVINGWFIPFYRAMKSRGMAVEDVIRTACEVSDSYFAPVPGPILKIAGRLAFGRVFRMVLKQQAARSQKKRFPRDWVFEVVAGNGREFDLALVMTECAVHKMYAQFEVQELAPYCNLFDLTYSRYMGMGLDATRTIGLGCETCTLAYKKGGETLIPETLDGLMPDID